MRIEKVKIDDLIPATYNPRKDLQPQDEEYKKIKRSIETFGYVEPIVWNERTKTVVGGHQRLKVLKDLGYEEIDCVVVDLDDVDERVLNIALNKIEGEFSLDKLKRLLNELNEENVDLSLTGFDDDELESLLETFDDVEISDEEVEGSSERIVGVECPSCGYVGMKSEFIEGEEET